MSACSEAMHTHCWQFLTQHAMNINVLVVPQAEQPMVQEPKQEQRNLLFMTSLCVGLISAVTGGKTYLKNSMKEKPYPCCSAIPAHTTLADAPISVPLPTETRKQSQRKVFFFNSSQTYSGTKMGSHIKYG